MSANGPERCWVEVSLGQIGRNFDAVRTLVGPDVEVVAVVKANACGHGAVPVSRALCQRGARWLAVTSVEEGVLLRQAGIGAKIMVLSGYLPDERAAMMEHDLTPVVHSVRGIYEWHDANRSAGRTALYHLKLDTGLWRLGTRSAASEVAEAVLACPGVVLEGLMTHFAAAGDFAGTRTDNQTDLFLSLASRLAEMGIRPGFRHLAGTVAVAYGRRNTWQNMVRVAHALYGYVANLSGFGVPQSILRVTPALTWKAAILEIKDVPAGAEIGYRGTFRAPERMRVAVVAAGYGDGVPHQLANKGRVIAGGRRSRMLGAIAMDLLAVDVSHAPSLREGDAVTLLGQEGDSSLDAQEIGEMAGTSSYAVLCGIASRVKRVYVE